MTVKEYLEQARFLDLRIDAKLEEVDHLNALATKATTVYSDAPGCSDKDSAKMAKTIEKIIDLENEISRDIDSLIDLKRDILSTIKQVPNQEYQYILEQRYLNFVKWEQIAVEMSLDLRWIYRRHGMALAEVQKIMEKNKFATKDH
ncbi:MAG: hypothetical protein NC093_08960 [Alistipes sp.]|nr:hypothetical protein [Alistipes sp.]